MSNKYTGTSAARIALTDMAPGDEYEEDDTGSFCKYTSAGWVYLRVGGAAIVRNVEGTGEVTKNRNINAAATTYAAATNSATWTSADNVTDINIVVKSATAAAIQNDEFVLVVYDVTNEAVAAGFFADTGGISSDIEYEMIPVGVPISRQFTSYLSRIDVLPLNDTMRVIVKAQ